MRIIAAVRDLVLSIHNAHLRRKVLNRKLQGLTDPTFLDRALAGEKAE